jgi:hypothetical protein
VLVSLVPRRVALAAAVVSLAVAGWGCGSADEGSSTCDQRFQPSAWWATSDDDAGRLDVGKAIVRCRWLAGWSRARVRRALGRPEPTGDGAWSWPLADDPHALGPTLWVLEVTFDARDRVQTVGLNRRPY